MPGEGIEWLERKELLSYEEMLRLCGIATELGINKIRLTGGEPFARKGFPDFLQRLSEIQGLHELTLTTNGVLTAPHIPLLKSIGIKSVNLSLDTLNRNRFFSITRRDELDKVLDTLYQLVENDIGVKVNAVVMDGRNTEDIIPLAELTKELPISIRYIEEMPFNGTGAYDNITWDYHKILTHLQETYPTLQKIADPAHSTSYNYQVPGYEGTVGIIAAYTRSFCGSCNRIRLTPQGVLKTCLYEAGGVDIKELLRSSVSNNKIKEVIVKAVQGKATDGHEAERNHIIHKSMATIGG